MLKYFHHFVVDRIIKAVLVVMKKNDVIIGIGRITENASNAKYNGLLLNYSQFF